MKLYRDKMIKIDTTQKAEFKRPADTTMDLKLQLNQQINSPRALKYKMHSFQTQQNSQIGLNPLLKKSEPDIQILQEAKIIKGSNFLGQIKAASIYDQLLKDISQKQEKQQVKGLKQLRTLSQTKNSKTNVQQHSVPDQNHFDMSSLVTRVPQLDGIQSQRQNQPSHIAKNNINEIYMPKVTQTEKNSQTKNKTFQFPQQAQAQTQQPTQGGLIFIKPMLKKILLPITLKPLDQSNENVSKETVKGIKTSSDKKQKAPIQLKYYLGKVEAAFKQPLQFDIMNKLIRDHFVQTYQGLNFTKQFQAQKPYDKKKYHLPKNPYYKDKITVIFDLDETLVHCNDNASAPHDVLLNIQINPQTVIRAGINVRPHARQILQNLKDDFEIIVFTASHICYAQKVIEYLDPEGTRIQHRLFREHCTLTTQNLYVKDLQAICDENRPMSRMVLVDNAAYSYGWQPENGIPIIPYYDNRSDRELQDLEIYLKGLVGVKDVREYNRDQLKLHNMVEHRGPQKAFQNVFGYEIKNEP